MRRLSINQSAFLLALGFCLVMGPLTARADVSLETFDAPDYDPELAISFMDPNNTITPDATNWTIDLTTSNQSDYYGYARSIIAGTNYDISGETTLDFDFTLNEGGSYGTEVFVVLEDLLGGVSVYKTRFSLGNHIYKPLLANPTYTDGTGPADLTDLYAIQIQANSFAPGTSGTVSAPYSITFNDLKATSPVPADPSVVTDFNNVGVYPGYESWGPGTVTNGPEAMNVVASGFGGSSGPVFGTLEASGNTHAELDVTINSSDGPVNIIALLEDADGTQNVWRWAGLTNDNGINGGNEHLLSYRMETVTTDGFADPPVLIDNANSWQTVYADSTPGDLTDNGVLDLDHLVNFHVQVEPQQMAPNDHYDVSFNNFRVKDIAGGFDTDNDSDGADFLTWQRGLTPHPLSSQDLLEWQNNYGNVVPFSSSSSALQQVPEPASVCLLFMSAIVIVKCRFSSFNR